MIDYEISGPAGNAYAIIGSFDRYMRDLGAAKEVIDSAIEDMRSDDYEHLLYVFNEHLGDFVRLTNQGNALRFKGGRCVSI